MSTAARAKSPKPSRHRSPKRRAIERKVERIAQIEQAILPPAGPGTLRRRHWGVMLSFVLLVLAPLAVAGWYLSSRAADQYASTLGFTVRQAATVAPAVEILGGLTDVGGSTTTDTDILYTYLFSQDLVRRVDAAVDLRALWSKPDNDPVFAFYATGTIEDLLRHWHRMTRVTYDAGAGLLEVRILAFDPDDALAINRAVFDASAALVNDLSAVGRRDATRYATEDLQIALARVKEARRALTDFRNETRLVDPNTVIEGQVGILNTLQTQLAEALIEMDLLTGTTRDTDPRLTQMERRIDVIRSRMEQERDKLGFGGGEDGDAYAALVSDYDGLRMDLEFAEQSYTAALGAYDTALAEANRQTRYLAAYLAPTRAEQAEYPRRIVLFAMLGVFLFLAWAILILAYYSLKDRQARL